MGEIKLICQICGEKADHLYRAVKEKPRDSWAFAEYIEFEAGPIELYCDEHWKGEK